jgi:hypothetical protein
VCVELTEDDLVRATCLLAYGHVGVKCVMTLTADHSYSVASAYGAMFLGSSSPLGAKQLWKTAAPPRVRFFFWLVMHGRCWTANRRFRHGLQPDDRCVFCDQSSETMEHVLLGCPYSGRFGTLGQRSYIFWVTWLSMKSR